MSPDALNAVFEFVGGLMLWGNVRRLYRDKQTKGVSLLPTAFFTSWGLWNLYFYPAVGAPLSFFGGAFLAVANLTWLGQMAFYRLCPWCRRELANEAFFTRMGRRCQARISANLGNGGAAST